MDGIEDLIDVHELVLDVARELPETGLRIHPAPAEPLPLVLGHGARLRDEVHDRLRALVGSTPSGGAPVLTLSAEVMPGRPDWLAIRLAACGRVESLHLPVAGAVALY